MKVYAISDLHLSGNNPKPMDIFGSCWADYLSEISADWHAKVQADDIVLIAGDISWAMTLENARPDLRFICELPGHKVITRGTHDYWWHAISAVRGCLTNNTYAVQNDCLRIGDVLVCGSRGWATPETGASVSAEDKKIYDREVVRFKLSLDAMEKMRRDGDRVVAMIHYPPFNSRREPSPFTKLFEEHGVNAVVYGHLHGKGGRIDGYREVGGIGYYLTSCDLVGNKLVEIL